MEADFVQNSFMTVARGNFGEVKKAQFRDAAALSKRKIPTIYADHWAALKYPIGNKTDFRQQFNDLSHEVSCTVILHPYLGKLVIRLECGKY